ncbi:MAG: type II secretion system protein [Patescibacteria group bacterium]
MTKFYKKGITIIELVIVLFIIGILASVTLPQFSKMKENQALKNATGDIVSALHGAQSQSLASVNFSEYGVHFQSDKIIIFKGTVFLESDANNKIINIVTPASISNVTLAGVSGTSGDIYFNRLSGVPNKTGAITVSISSVSKIITISATGAVSIN